MWHNDCQFQSLSLLCNNVTYYVNDFVSVRYEEEIVIVKILKFYQKVCSINFIHEHVFHLSPGK